ncbi:Helicase required for RNAi-mediated heterochromatin assembly 1 [Diplonema papillatum]|nr:Helicase required for RNAi-mediated heterochromatin assembly 1 [Diplonema papillatum]
MAPPPFKWADASQVARAPVTLLDLCSVHPRLQEYYARADNVDEREMALNLFMDTTPEAVAVKEQVINVWLEEELLATNAACPWTVSTDEPMDHTLRQTRILDRGLAAPTDDSYLQSKMHIQRQNAFSVWKKSEVQREKKDFEQEKKQIQHRRKEGLSRELQIGAELEGVIVALNEDTGFGDVFVPERNATTSFMIDWADYGLRQIRLQDKVNLRIDAPRVIRAEANAPARSVRERATCVRPMVDRELTPADVAAFCAGCKATTQPGKMVQKIIVNQADWAQLVGILAEKPATVGGGGGISWYECVMSIIELCAYPALRESRFRPVLARFFRNVQATLFLDLVKDLTKLVCDNTQLLQGLDIAVFVESLRNFCYKSGSPKDIPQSYFDFMVGLLESLNKAYSESAVRPNEQAQNQLRVLCARIRFGTESRKVFPSMECFLHSPDDPMHPLHSENLPIATKLPWKSVDDYVGCHFNLLRADCFHNAVRSIQWRLGCSGFEPSKKEEVDLDRSTKQYRDVRVVGEAVGNRGLWMTLRFEKPPAFNPFKQLEKDTLVCVMTTSNLDKNNAATKMWWCTVPFNDMHTTDAGIVVLEVLEGDPDEMLRSLRQNEALGVSQTESMFFETQIFFTGYKSVLEALDHLRREKALPFNETLLRGVATSEVKRLPGYVPECYKKAFLNIVNRMLERYVYEPGQHRALRWLPHRPLLLIQGPPGTGKSFIGSRLVECVAEFRIRMANGELKNEYEAANDDGSLAQEGGTPGPIVVLTYKNHSLDEFLLDCLDSGVWCGDLRDPTRCACQSTSLTRFCCKNCCDRQGHAKKLVRIGSRSQSARLHRYNIMNNVKAKFDHKPKMKSLRRATDLLAESIRTLDNGKVDADLIRTFYSHSQLETFLADGTSDDKLLEAGWSKWLDGGTPLEHRTEELQLFGQSGEHIMEVALDPDDVDEAFNKEKEAASRLRNQYMSQQAQQRSSDDAAASSNFNSMRTDGKNFESVDQDFVNNLRSRRAFYSSLVLQEPVNSRCTRKATPQDIAACAEGEEVPNCLRTGPLITPPFADVDDLWSLSREQRLTLAAYWVLRHREGLYEQYERRRKEFQELLVIDQYLFDESRLEVLRKADIIGCTTTGAAMSQALLRAVKPSVLMVEEAAEILESQVLSCFVDSVAQVILIGDHKQLMPSVDCRAYAEHNRMEMSMFQRLIETCRAPFCQLTEQRRMVPAICDVVRPIYDTLTDFHTLATRTMAYGGGKVLRLPGFSSESIFWAHQHPEEASSVGLSVVNHKEVQMVQCLVRFLVCKEGLRPDQLTVLTPYLGQSRELKSALKTEFPTLSVLTVDRFQGDENDIIIVSLTRTAKLTSFMKLENRMCVACSRARFGFFLLGNPELLTRSPHWHRTLNIIRNQSPGADAISTKLTMHRNGKQLVCSSSAASLPDPRDPSVWQDRS